jgi:cation diffusion facilitator CzcD-associated flavoprotein CzcO
MTRQIKDDVLREKLTPDFTIGCKRILVSNTYYPALQKNNCFLHDKNDGIEKFNIDGIYTTNGTHIKVDAVAFATGYDAITSMVSYEVVGKDGVRLSEQWSEYPRAYLGTSLPNFPNFFTITGPNTGIGHTSAIFVIESQLKYVMSCIDTLSDQNVRSIEPTKLAENVYTEMIHQEMDKTVWANGGCSSWYQNSAGKVIAMYPGFSFVYRQMCKRFKTNDHLIEEN